MTDERKEYLKEYRKTNLKRIPLDVPLDMYAQIKECADNSGYKVNTWIKIALRKAIRDDTIRYRAEQAAKMNWY